VSGFRRVPTTEETIAYQRRVVAEIQRGVLAQFRPPGHDERILAIIDNLTARLAAPAPKPKTRRRKT
jgi:hypothetical protein